MAEKNNSKLKVFVFSLIFAILVITLFFYKIQKRLMLSDPLQNDPKKSEENILKTDLKPDQNKPDKIEKKIDYNQKKDKETEKLKSTLTWPEFSQKLKTFEDKRQNVLTQLEQKLLNHPPDKNIESLKIHNIQIVTKEIITESIGEEKISWGKVIQHWQQLNDQQQRFSKLTKTD